MKTIYLYFFVLLSGSTMAQEKNSAFYELSTRPDAYTASTVASEFISALGFRFYWASADLNAENIVYKVDNNSRSILETTVHIHGLTEIIKQSLQNQVYEPVNLDVENTSFEAIREAILMNLEETATMLRAGKDLEFVTIKFTNSSYPFWNLINGPISDAIWHTGQIATIRRLAGNPISAKINHFTAKIKE